MMMFAGIFLIAYFGISIILVSVCVIVGELISSDLIIKTIENSSETPEEEIEEYMDIKSEPFYLRLMGYILLFVAWPMYVRFT